MPPPPNDLQAASNLRRLGYEGGAARCIGHDARHRLFVCLRRRLVVGGTDGGRHV
jgi:hypothetical protein